MIQQAQTGFDLLPLNGGGGLILSAHPAGLPGLSPEQAVSRYSQLGARALVSLVTDPELQKLGLTMLPDLCASNQMRWLHGPIEDYQAPNALFDQWWLNNRDILHAMLDEGHSVALHCWGGRGRTGTVAARILVERGLAPVDAMTIVRAHRPGAIETAEQADYVMVLSA